jgi:hypothetical protein
VVVVLRNEKRQNPADIKGNPFYFESSPYAFELVFAGLLRTCHQLRAETLEREAKVRDRIPYVLDLPFVNETNIWVTWLLMPLRHTKVIDHLQINVRAFACHQILWEESYGPRARRLCAVLDGLVRRIFARGISRPVPGGRIKDAIVRANQGKIRSDGGHWKTYYTPRYCIQRANVDTSCRISRLL